MSAFQIFRNKRRRKLLKEVEEEEEFQTIQHKRPWICQFSVPYRIAKHSFTIKSVYLLVCASFAAWILNTPRSESLDYKDSGDVLPQYKTRTLLLVFLSTCSLFFFQASNPGYMEDPKFEQDLESKEFSPNFPISRKKKLRSHTKETPEDEYLLREKESSDESSFSDTSSEMDLDVDEKKDHELSGIESCQLPIRAKYCRRSKKIVYKFDHFCGILNTPVGERNHFRFIIFLFFNSILLIWGLKVSRSAFHDTKPDIGYWIKYNGRPLFNFIVLLLINLMFTSLFLFHIFLMCTSLTTYEFMRTEKIWYLKDQHLRDFDLPFSRGLCTNIVSFVKQDGMWYIFSKRQWVPIKYEVSLPDREATDIWNNIWENKYYSCC
eukprot:snap_masked-scaffold_2-processed-gene-26.8-mRNA-1 protein AED:0.77 eAED:0.77 QI:0/-1/0/1/-1/1/1/0/377